MTEKIKLVLTYPDGTKYSYKGFTMLEVRAIIAASLAKSYEVIQ